MKKLLCFTLGIILAVSGLRAQQDCVHFTAANLYPSPETQSILINFNDVQEAIVADGKYALHYEFFKDGEPMSDIALDADFDLSQTTFTTRFTSSNYYGQYITHSSDFFPNGYFTAVGNMSNYNYNYLTGAYLLTTGAQLRLNLGWRSDVDYRGHSYMLAVSLVSLTGGTSHIWQYSNTSIGGYNATPTGNTVLLDTITTIKYLDYEVNDTICYSVASTEEYQYSEKIGNARNITITADTIAKYAQPAGSTFAAIIPMDVTFGNHGCNERIDSIGTVNFYVWANLSVTFSPSGNVSGICAGSTAGAIKLIFDGVKSPLTITAYRSDTEDGEYTQYGEPIIRNGNGTFNYKVTGLEIGFYKFTVTDGTGCSATTATAYQISEMQPKNWDISTIEATAPTCYNGENGSIHFRDNGQMYGYPVFTLYDENNNVLSTISMNIPKNTTTDSIYRNLPAGTYYLSSSDTRGCKPANAPYTITINNPDSLGSKDTIYACVSELTEGVHYKNTDTVFTEAGEKVIPFTSVLGCDSLVTVTLIVFANPTIAFDDLTDAVCQNAELDIQLVSDDMRDGYYWTYDGGTLAEETDASGDAIRVSWATAGEKTVSANYTQYYNKHDGTTLGCRAVSDTTTIITVNVLPTVTVTTKVNDTDSTMNIVACAGDAITLTAVNDEEYDYSWSQNGNVVFTEGNEFVLEDVTPNYNGKYVLVITNYETGCVNSSDTVNITVNAPMVTLRDQMEDVTICPDGQALLNVIVTENTGELSYKWYMNGDEITDATNNSYNVEGLTDTTTYTVEVTATIGACTATAYDTVVVNVNNPSVTLTPMDDQTICAALNNETGTTVEALVASSHGNLTYAWTSNMNASFSDPAVANPAVTLTDTTTIYLHVIATIGTNADNACTAEAFDTMVINVNAPMVQLSEMADQTICAGDEAKIYPNIIADSYKSDETTYLWNTGATTDTIIVSPNVDKEYSVTVTAKVGDCTFTANDAMTVTVLSPSLTLGDTITGERTICKGERPALTVWMATAPNGTISYEWNTGETTSTITPEPTDTTKYVVTVTATLTANNTNCSVSAKDSVVVNVNAPAITLNAISGPDHNTICLGDNATLTASPASSHGEVTYQWLQGQTEIGTTAEITVTPTEITDYSVIATTMIGNCPAQNTKNYTVYVNAPAIDMNDIASQTICAGGDATFRATTNTLVANTTSSAWTTTPSVTLTPGTTDAEQTVSPTTLDTIRFEVVGTATVNTNEVACPATDTVRFFLAISDTVKYEVTDNLSQQLCWEDLGDTVRIDVHNATASTTSTGIGTESGENYLKVFRNETTPIGETSYHITIASNNGCTSTNKTLDGTFTILDTVTYTISGDTTFAICVGSEITPIVINTSNNGRISASNVTGLSETGLSFGDNSITGTPSTVGAIRYTVNIQNSQSTDEHPCAGTSFTGTITVNDTVKLSATHLVQSAPCAGEDAIEDVVITVQNGTVVAPTLPAGLTFDANNLTISGTPTTATIEDNEPYAHQILIVANSDKTPACTPDTLIFNLGVNPVVELTATTDTNQSVCVASEITPIVFEVEYGSIEVKGLENTGLTFGDGNSISGTPTTVGEIHYMVIATSDQQNNRCANDTITGTITVNDTVKYTITGGDTTQNFCLGNSLTEVTINVVNGTPSFSWTGDMSGVTCSTTATSVTLTGAPSRATEVHYTVTMTSANGCTNKAITGTIIAKDTVSLTVNGDTTQTLCLGRAITPVVFANENSTITCSFAEGNNNGLTFANGTLSGTPTAARDIKYTISATNNDNCGNKVITGTITVNDTVVENIVSVPAASTSGNITNTVFLCASPSEINDTVTFTTAADMTNYVWNVNGATILSGDGTNSIQAQWATHGTREVTVAYTNPTTGCRGTSAPATVKVIAEPAFTLTGSEADNRICADAKDTLKIESTYAANIFTWSDNTYLTPDGDYNKVFGSDNFAHYGEYNYVVTATAVQYDNFQCRVTHDITIIVDSLPTLTFTVVEPRCYGDENGDVTANVIGSAPFTYNWNNGCTNAANQNLRGAVAPGATFAVTVTDLNGCIVTGDTVLIEPAELIVHKDSRHNVSCFEGVDGSFRVYAEGGTPFTDNKYQYVYNNVDQIKDTFNVTELAAGSYTVNVLDAHGCSKSISDTITEPEELVITSVKIENVKCNGDNDGSIILQVTGGTVTDNAPYIYEWEGPEDFSNEGANNPAEAKDLFAGSYTITITDNNNCVVDTTVAVTEPAELVATVDPTHHISCNGGNDGYIRVGVTGGTYAYTYEWITAVENFTSTSDSIRNDLKAGEYKIVVKDAHNCTDTVTFTLEEPEALTVTAIDSVNISCAGGNNGSITLTVANGTDPYTYAWTGPESYTNDQATGENLVAGTYEITITDFNGCSLDTVVKLTQPDTLKIKQEQIADITCFGLTDGRFEVNAEGGTPDYRYKWDDETMYTGTVYHNTLTRGEHIIAMVDANNCVDTIRFTINEPAKLEVEHEATNLTCFETNDGAINITVTGGTAANQTYTYVWADNVSTKDRSELAAGTYYLMAYDDNECKAYDTITITQPDQFSINIPETINHEICEDGGTTFTATLLVGGEEVDETTGYTFKWYKNGVAISGEESTTITVAEAGMYKIVATQTASGCVDSSKMELIVHELPVLTITAPDTVCYGTENINVYVDGADEYDWTSLDHYSDNVYNIERITETTIFEIEGTDSYNNGSLRCHATAKDTITVIALPEVAITSGPRDTICGTESMNLEATGANSYVWSGDGITGNGSTAVFMDPTVNYGSGSNTYNVIVTVEGTGFFGCKNTASDTITVNLLPEASFSKTVNGEAANSNNLVLCEGGKIVLTANNQYYDGDFTNNWYKVGTAATVATDVLEMNNVTTANNGRYVLVVTNDATGCQKTSDTVTVTVNALPTVTMTVDHNEICANDMFKFVATSQTAESYQWVYNGDIQNETTDTLYANEAGKYVVNVTDGNGCQNHSDTVTVTVNPMPDFEIIARIGDYEPGDEVELCLNDNVIFDVEESSEDIITGYTWVLDNRTISDKDTCAFVGTTVGEYTITVTATTEHNCTSTEEVTITVNALPNVTVAQDTVIVCLESEVTLSANGADYYDWNALEDLTESGNDLSDGVFLTGTADVPGTAGYYHIEVTGTVEETGCSAKDTLVVNVKDLQNMVTITLPKDTICLNETTGFKVHETYTSYTWKEQPGQNSCLNTTTGDTVTFTGLTAGLHTITVTVVDADGCNASYNTTVLVDTLPVITLNAAPQCQGDTVTFTTEAGMSDYTWNYQNENVTETYNQNGTLKLVWSNNGTKNVTVNYTDGNGCRAAEPTAKLVDVYALPTIVINPGDLDTICLGQTETITVDGPEGATFVWSTGDQGTSLDITPVADSIVSVIGTDAHNCKNYDTIRFIVNDTVKFTLTNIEQFICLGNPIENMVFDTANCTLNLSDYDLTQANLTVVDDTIKGVPENAGTYSYALVATSTATPACFSKYINVNIYVYDTTKLTVTNNEQTKCLGRPIDTIRIDTSNCTLSFEPALPAGLTFIGEESYIIGSIATAGNYTFNIKATSNASACSDDEYSKVVKVDITINDTNKLATVSDVEQFFCLGNPMSDIVLDTANCELSFEPALSHGISYDVENHKITGVPDTAMVFNYTITATNANGCNDPKTLAITITVNDTAKLELLSNSADQEFCFGNAIEPIAFKSANGEVSIEPELSDYGIDFANDTISGTPTEPGTYHYSIIVYGNYQCGYKEIAGTITVDTLPVVTITSDQEDGLICPEGQEVATLTATENADFSYAWAHSTTTVTDTAIVMPVADSTFTVTVTDGNECSSSASITIGVHTLPSVTITGIDTICFGNETELTVVIEGEEVESIAWSTEDEDNVITVAPVADSIFTVTIEDVNGCTTTASDTVIVNALPVVGLTKNITADAICQNDTVIFTANTGDNYSYEWYDNEEELDNAGNTYTFVTFADIEESTETGEHEFTVTITDGNECSNTETITIIVNATPVLTEEHNRVKCFGNENAYIDLTVDNVTSDDNYTYAWTKEETSVGADEDLDGIGAGDYTVVVATAANCSSTLTVTIEQPDTLTAVIDTISSVRTLCNGIGKVVVTVTGGTTPYEYTWDGDGIVEGATDTLQISDLAIGDHGYTVIVTDDSGCVASVVDPWYVTSQRYEAYREINLMPGETYTHGDVTYTDADNGATFEDVVTGVAEGGCDSAYVYTVHVHGLGFYFADDFTVTHSSYRQNYVFNPHRIGDTIITGANVDNMFYAYAMTDSVTWDADRVDVRYEVLFNDNPIETVDYDSMINLFNIMAYHEHDNRFYGYGALQAANGEHPANTFFYQTPSNSTAYFYDYFNFRGFNRIPQRIQFNFTEAGTYTIKLYVEKRNGGDAGEYWGIYNPYVVNRQYGPIWGGRNDNPSGKETISARYMTVIVNGEGDDAATTANPAITSIEDYTTDAEPVVTTYPNPAYDMLYLNISGMEGMTYITITDAAGKVVATYNENLLNSETTLNYSVAKFAQGIYFLNVNNNDTVITKKFIVTK